jgi:hypothetical protein
MKKISLTAAVVGATLITALTSAGTAAAIPPSGTAADVVKALQDQGYSVQLNGPVSGPLSRCTVNGVHGLVVMMVPDGTLMMQMDPSNPGDVFVDVSCPSSNN